MDLEKRVSMRRWPVPTALCCGQAGNLWASVFKDRAATSSIRKFHRSTNVVDRAGDRLEVAADIRALDAVAQSVGKQVQIGRFESGRRRERPALGDWTSGTRLK